MHGDGDGEVVWFLKCHLPLRINLAKRNLRPSKVFSIPRTNTSMGYWKVNQHPHPLWHPPKPKPEPEPQTQPQPQPDAKLKVWLGMFGPARDGRKKFYFYFTFFLRDSFQFIIHSCGPAGSTL